MERRRVVVTGLGAVSPLGNTLAENWDAILDGKSGVAGIRVFNPEHHTVKIAAEVKGLDLSPYMDKKEARRMDQFIQYGMVAGIQAIQDAGLEAANLDLSRVGVSVGSGIGGINTIEATRDTYVQRGPKKISPFFVPSAVINMISGNLSIRYGYAGPNLAVTTACTTGTHNIGMGARLIQWGDADTMIVGGAEWATSPITIGGFANMRALSMRNEEPEAASRPWDRERDGFVLGDGAAVLVLEEYEQAKSRGADIYAEVTGFGMSADANHITSPRDNGEGFVACMQNAINDAHISSDAIQYINAHGTSTPQGDVAETRAIKTVFGSDTKVPISSTKSMTGHLLGAAGAIEAVYSVLAVKNQIAPATINLDNPDEECDLDYIPHTARDMTITSALSNSFGFGGTNATVIFRQV
ncbi:MAG: beta-ketoacyl-ACP synthase II [Pseudomonadales bacterium]|nr:beta-ketoacyl-ACP synthase II [Pseudomonadales bacterium]